jgi:hypothetical protein
VKVFPSREHSRKLIIGRFSARTGGLTAKAPSAAKSATGFFVYSYTLMALART